MPPQETHMMVQVTAMVLRRAGVNSATRVVKVGRAPLIPTPERKRKRPSDPMPCARLTHAVASPKTSTLPITARRLPSLSAIMPAYVLPMTIPIMLVVTAGAKPCSICPTGGHLGNDKADERHVQSSGNDRRGCKSHDRLCRKVKALWSSRAPISTVWSWQPLEIPFFSDL